jgi:hypothetical protein
VANYTYRFQTDNGIVLFSPEDLFHTIQNARYSKMKIDNIYQSKKYPSTISFIVTIGDCLVGLIGNSKVKNINICGSGMNDLQKIMNYVDSHSQRREIFDNVVISKSVYSRLTDDLKHTFIKENEEIYYSSQNIV